MSQQNYHSDSSDNWTLLFNLQVLRLYSRWRRIARNLSLTLAWVPVSPFSRFTTQWSLWSLWVGLVQCLPTFTVALPLEPSLFAYKYNITLKIIIIEDRISCRRHLYLYYCLFFCISHFCLVYRTDTIINNRCTLYIQKVGLNFRRIYMFFIPAWIKNIMQII